MVGGHADDPELSSGGLRLINHQWLNGISGPMVDFDRPPKCLLELLTVELQSGPQHSVLFIDTDNAWRSIVAEVLLDHWGGRRFRAFSAGTHPAGQLNQACVFLLQQSGLATSHLHSKNWRDFHQPGAPVMDFVFLLSDEVSSEAWPCWPGNPITAQWSLPDPQSAEGSAAERMLACRDVYGMIERRVRILASLRLANHGRGDIQRSVCDIDRAEAERGTSRAA